MTTIQKRQCFAVIMALLVPLATIGGMLAVGTASVSAVTVFEDFEDGDLNEWTLTNWENPDVITSNPYEGSYHMNVDAHNFEINRDISISQPTNISWHYYFSDFGNYDSPRVSFFNGGNGGTKIQDMYVTSGGGVKTTDGTFGSLNTGQYYQFRLENIDYSNNHFDLAVYSTDGTQIIDQNGISFVQSANDIDNWQFRQGKTDGRASFSIDYLRINSDQAFPPETYSLDGVVKDKDGNSLSGATVSTNTSKSTTTASDGSYSLSLVNGSYDLTFSADGYTNVTKTATVSGSAVSDINATLVYPLTGRMVDDSGNGIANATVTVFGATQPNVPDSLGELENLSDPIPTDWESQLSDGFSVDGFLDNNQSQIPIVVDDTIANKGSTFWSLEADPIFRKIPAKKPVTVLGWDPTKGTGNIVSVQDDLDQQLPGARIRDPRDVTFDRLSASGDTTDSITVTTNSIAGDLEAAEVALPQGIYRVSMEGTDASYLAKVGSLKSLITDFQEQANGALTQVDQTVRKGISGGSIVRKRVTTGSDGSFSVPLPSGVNAVQIQGLKQPDITEGSETVSLLNSTESYEVDTLKGSMYLPTVPQRVDVPASNVELSMTEISVNPFAGPERVNNLTKALRAAIGNITMADLPSSLQQPTSNVSREDLENVTSRLQNLSTENEELRQRLRDELQNQTGSTDVVVNVSEQSSGELRERLSIMRQELTELRGQLTVEPGDGSVGDGTISRTFVVDGAAIPEDSVAVFADYSNGTSTLVSEEYLTVDQSAATAVGAGQTEIRIEEYPLGETDPAAVQFRVDVASEDGVGSGVTDPITNPAVDADPPGLEHVDWSSLHPGPGEQTSLRVVGEDDSTFARVTSATVVGPDGSTINSSVSNGETVSFTTAGEGTHVVRTTFEDTSGNQYVTPLRVVASNRSYDMPATMRVSSAPAGGTFALTGDGLAGGKVVTDQTRSDVDLTARLDAKDNGDPEIPDRLKIWTSSMHLPQQSDITARVVDSSGQSVDERIPVKIHTANLPEDGYMYRQDGGDWEPFTKSGSQWGSWHTESGQTVIDTVTDADGEISIRRSADPGLREQIWYRIQTSLDGLPF